MNEIYRDLGGFTLLLAVLGAIVFLAYTKTIDSQAAVGIITTLVSLAGGALVHANGVKAGSKAANGHVKK